MSVYVWTGTTKTGINAITNELGQRFNLTKFITERNSTIGIHDGITYFPDIGFHKIWSKSYGSYDMGHIPHRGHLR